MVSGIFFLLSCKIRRGFAFSSAVAILALVAIFPFIFSKQVLAEWGDINGATWHYFSHNSPLVDWARWESFCQGNYVVSAISTRGNWCEEGHDGLLYWTHNLIASCNRPCTTCPDTSDFSGCNMVTCSSGWWGDLSGCAPESGNLSISIFNDRDGDGVREADEDSVSALVRIYQSGVGEVHMFTGTGLDRDFPDGDYRVKIEPLSGWIPTKWSVDHEPATGIFAYKACAVWALPLGIGGITYSNT